GKPNITKPNNADLGRSRLNSLRKCSRILWQLRFHNWTSRVKDSSSPENLFFGKILLNLISVHALLESCRHASQSKPEDLVRPPSIGLGIPPSNRQLTSPQGQFSTKR